MRHFQNNRYVKEVAGFFFYTALVLEIMVVLIDKSAMTNPIEGRLFQLTFCLFLIKVLLTEYDLREYLIICIGCIFGLWIDQAADRNEILRFAIFIASCKDVDIKKALKLTLWLSTVGCIVIMLLSVFGIYGDLTVIKEYPGEYAGEITKRLYAFGMGNANAFHCMFFSLTLLGMYLYGEVWKWWGYALIFGANIGLYFLTDSKTATALTALAVVGMFGVSALQKRSETAAFRSSGKRFGDGKALNLLGGGCLVLCALCPLISVWFAAQAWKLNHKRWSIWDFNGTLEPGQKGKRILIEILDRLLTGRITTLTGTINWDGATQSWRWFPVENHNQYFDLGFVRLFYWYGIFPALIILAVFAMLLRWLLKREQYRELVLLTILAVYTVAEAHFVSVYLARNYAFLLLGLEMFSWNKVFIYENKRNAKAN